MFISGESHNFELAGVLSHEHNIVPVNNNDKPAVVLTCTKMIAMPDDISRRPLEYSNFPYTLAMISFLWDCFS